MCMAGPFSGGWDASPPLLLASGFAPSPAMVPVLKADHKHVQNGLLMLQKVKGQNVPVVHEISLTPHITLRSSSEQTRSYELMAVIVHRGSAKTGHFVVRLLLKPPPCTPDQHTCACVCWASGCWASGIALRVLGSCVAHRLPPTCFRLLRAASDCMSHAGQASVQLARCRPP